MAEIHCLEILNKVQELLVGEALPAASFASIPQAVDSGHLAASHARPRTRSALLPVLGFGSSVQSHPSSHSSTAAQAWQVPNLAMSHRHVLRPGQDGTKPPDAQVSSAAGPSMLRIRRELAGCEPC